MNPDQNQPPAPTEQPQTFDPQLAVAQTPETPGQGPTPAEQFSQPTEQPVPTAPVVVAPTTAAPTSSKGLAIASLVVGVIGFLTGFLGIGILLGLIAVILGIVSLAKHKGGKGQAITGIVFGALALFLGPIAMAITMSTYAGLQGRALESLCEAQTEEGVALDARCSEL